MIFDQFPVSPAHTPYDWAALRETYRAHIETLEMEFLAELYGLSRLRIMRDEDFCAQVKAWLDNSSEPVRAWFELAYYLASAFWEDTLLWNMRDPHAENYYGPFPEELIEDIMRWLLAGIHKYRDDRELMQNVHWLRYREMMGDTCLRKEEHFPILEEALGYQIQGKNDEIMQALVRKNLQGLRELQEGKDEHEE